MNQLTGERRAQVVRCLVEGNSIRSTVRMTGVAKNTIVKLLVELGSACSQYHDRTMRNLKCKTIQVDEIWSFCYAKQKNIPDLHEGEWGYGDVWTWIALDAETKLVALWFVGTRDGLSARIFIEEMRSRLSGRFQLTSDGHHAYLEAVQGVFKGDIDYAQLVKIYGPGPLESGKYSPAACLGSKKKVRSGNPDESKISTSYVERQNLTMRMCMRRFTRLTNAFSKKIENHEAAIALHFMYINFCRKHQTLKTTPAVAAGLADHAWSIEELVGLLDQPEINNLKV
jgi:IS1 family transposase